MSTKKQHIDPTAKRDWKVLTKKAIEGIKDWFKAYSPKESCPFVDSNGRYGKKICQGLFPEVKSDCDDIHPCTILYVSDVKKVAREAIAEWEKNHDLH